MARGQSNIFGAIEEKGGAGSFHLLTGQVVAQRCVVAGGSETVFAEQGRGGANLVEWAAGLSTGRAQEMQSASREYRVAVTEYRLPSCEFRI